MRSSRTRVTSTKAADAIRVSRFSQSGKVAERLNVLVSNTSRVRALESSNLSLPANWHVVPLLYDSNGALCIMRGIV